MSTRRRMLALAVAVALGAPAAAVAQDLDFNYIEGGFIAGFVNDVEESDAFTDNGTLDVESDAGGGAFIGGAWEFRENMHLFGDYALTGQELEVRDGIDTVEGDYDVVRWRLGVGYAYPFSPTMSLYGRLSFDNIEFKDVKVAGFDLDADVDDSGIGGEIGMLWAATPALHLQGHVRYTSVGEVVGEGSDAFDADILLALNGRWYFRPDMALVTGYEFGKITFWNVGVRFAF
ncbi:outer membrane beta-barrel protein [Thioalkalivibrio sp. XN279]|uniref:outer membrane beta-barrel protein n=1 Tax=Thioalkalivibrio sp. XN279 TaxID=2714953 RepID=UPI00140ACC2D|nr:outer membrane beta-barrel protein [Thioalkalivibrio sp. XN279]NHA13982.1 outer membrane beta-barrel protein [Thioalkalivibrio sp. XN279]